MELCIVDETASITHEIKQFIKACKVFVSSL